MAPLIRSGDAVKVVRGSELDVRPGDIALVAFDGGRMVAHCVGGVDPVRTFSLRGVPDPSPAEVVGRVVALRINGFEVRLTAFFRHLLLSQQRLIMTLRRLRGIFGHAVS